MKKVVLLIVALLCGGLAMGQSDNELWQECLERWAEDAEQTEIDDETMELLQQLHEEPINLNDTTSDALLKLPFINPLQRAMLKAYIQQYGAILSWSELGGVRGFDSTTIALLKPFTRLSNINNNEDPSLKEMLRYGKRSLIVGGKLTLEPIEGYGDGAYAGSPTRGYFRYQFKYRDRVTLQISGDKDPGEAFFGEGQRGGFDYYGYYLQVKEIGPVKNAIIGKYQLQFGQGVTLWSGFAPWNVDGSSIWRYGQGIKTSSAFCEYGYLDGGAATFAIGKHLDLTTFYSYRRHDATETDSGDAVLGISYSGYHRTETEIAKKDNLGEQLFGANLQYRRESFSAGVTAYRSTLDKSIEPRDYIYNSYAFAGKENDGVGAYFAYRKGNLITFGESALSDGKYKDYETAERVIPLATMVGFQYQVDSRNKLSGYYRYYSPSYQNMHASPIGQGASGQNEEGVCMILQTQLPMHIGAQLSADLFRYPWMRYRVYAPSWGSEYRVRMEKSVATNTKLVAQYRMRQNERNLEGDSYETGETVRHQLLLRLDYEMSEQVKWSTRVSYSWFKEEGKDWERGFLAYQNLSLRPLREKLPLSVDCRYVIFNVSDYDARIYCFENDFVYEFATPSFQGKGCRAYAMVKYELCDGLSCGLKYGITQYFDRESIGSGHEKIDRSHRQEVKVQIRYNF